MKIERFEDIFALQKARVLTKTIYKLFGSSRDFGFRDQITRCTVSIMNNIAEGFERRGDKEFSHFLFIAKGSCGELRSMLYLAKDLEYISSIEFAELYNSALEVSRMLSGLISSLK